METAGETRDALRKDLLALEVTQYQELAERWKALETKAQGNVSIAGIFVAAAFAFLREMHDASDFQRMLLVAAFVLLVMSVIAAMRALRVRHVVATPAPVIAQTIEKILKTDDNTELALRADGLVADRIGFWRAAVEVFRRDYDEKAASLRTSQALLTLGIAAAAGLALMRAL